MASPGGYETSLEDCSKRYFREGLAARGSMKILLGRPAGMMNDAIDFPITPGLQPSRTHCVIGLMSYFSAISAGQKCIGLVKNAVLEWALVSLPNEP